MGASPSGTFNRPDLGQRFEEFDLLASSKGYIGTQVLPLFDASLQSANFTTLPIEALLADVDLSRAPGGGYHGDDFQFEQDSFSTKEYGTEQRVDDRERAIYQYAIDIETISRDRAMLRIARGLEKRIAAAVFNTTTWTGALTTAVTNKWSNFTNATPIDDVHNAMNTVRERIGELPNVLIIDWKTMRRLSLCNQLVERLKYWGGDDPNVSGLAKAEVLAHALGIERVIVAGGMKNTADKGQTASLSAVWSATQAMVARIATSKDLQEACIGRTFHFTADGSAGEFGAVEMYRDEKKRSDVIRVRHDVHEKIIYANAGQLLTNVG
ncbi:MAG TPA: hypothetical protein VEA38_12130 [Terriglobales bacterium]|nr:hypothetical protein [Terriglobales bacterium]